MPTLSSVRFRGGRKLSVRVQVVQSQCFVEPTRRYSLAGWVIILYEFCKPAGDFI